MLKTANLSPYGAKTLIMSTTWPAERAGRPEQPVAQVAEGAAEHQPERRSPTAPSAAGSAIQPIQPITTSVITGKTQVCPLPKLNAAPLLRSSDR